MGETSISWCHYTFNLWWGCFKVSPGCTNCYAAAFDRRVHGKASDHWERTGGRWFQSDEYWQQPLKWNEKAKREGVRYRVFCGSMMDWLEQHPNPEINRQMDAYRGRLFELIKRTPYLDWLLLTKRPQYLSGYLPWMRIGYEDPPWPNVWLGTTVEDQEHADKRIPLLLANRAVVFFLSCEPLLGALDLNRIRIPGIDDELHFSALSRQRDSVYGYTDRVVNWVIAGAESGPRARECKTEWLRSLRDQCAESDTGTAFFLKQAVESWTYENEDQSVVVGIGSRRKGKGFNKGTMVELPELDGKQHAEFPEVAHAA